MNGRAQRTGLLFTMHRVRMHDVQALLQEARDLGLNATTVSYNCILDACHIAGGWAVLSSQSLLDLAKPLRRK